MQLIPLARELLASLEIGDRTVVHGDFHHHNLVTHGDRYVAIDPKPYLGDPEFDVPSFLWNPIDVTTGNGSLPLERTLVGWRRSSRRASTTYKIRAWTVIRGAYLGATRRSRP